MALPTSRAPARVRAAALAIVLTAPAGCARYRDVLANLGHNFSVLVTGPRRLSHRITRPVRADARIAVLWVGHATALVQMDDRFVLTDPVFTSAVGALSPRLVEPGIDPADLPPIDAVLISHLHFDHLSPASLAMIEPRVARLFAPRGALVYIPPADFPAVELGWWERWEEGGLRVTAVPVQHVGWRYGVDSDWMTTSFTGYVVEYHGLTVYFGGDTAYRRENFVETARRFPHIDVALLPIAPVEPRRFMEPTHMDPEEAVRAFLDLRARTMVPIHFDTFVNSADAPGVAVRVLGRAMARHGLTAAQVAVLDIGEQRVLLSR